VAHVNGVQNERDVPIGLLRRHALSDRYVSHISSLLTFSMIGPTFTRGMRFELGTL
jgi:hypothetical protein